MRPHLVQQGQNLLDMQLHIFQVEYCITLLLLDVPRDQRVPGPLQNDKLAFSSRSSILKSISTIGLSRPLKCNAMTNVPGVGEVIMKNTFCRLYEKPST